MPFDFDIALDTLENLTEEERAGVLHAMQGLIGPIDVQSTNGPAKYFWWAKKTIQFAVSAEDSDQKTGIEVRSGYRGRLRADYVRPKRIYTVSFKCLEDDCFGVAITTISKEEKKERERIATEIALDKLEFVRKEKNIL